MGEVRFVLLLACGWSGLAAAQEGFPLDGTWRGEWGDGNAVVIVMRWNGAGVDGQINPGPRAVRFSDARLEPSEWTVRIEATGADGTPIVIDGALEDLGSYHRTITGTWRQGGAARAFFVRRE